MNNTKRTIGLITIIGFPVLGFYRGIKSYDYNYSNNKIHKSPTKPIYTDKLLWGFGGMLWYLNPIGMFFGLYKEVYRLEVNLRGIEDEKKTAYYNEVL